MADDFSAGIWKTIRMNPRTLRNVAKTVFTKQMFQQLRLAAISHAKAEPGICPACDYDGRFSPFGMPVRTGVMCPKCWSLERQRLLALAMKRGEIEIAGRDIIHFAGEYSVTHLILSKQPSSYKISEYEGDHGDVRLDIEHIDLPDNSLDLVIANHILEHIDDRTALAEIYRVLRPGGEIICMFPIIEGWSETYENSSITDPVGRDMHFGQWDHVRYYGSDVRDRIREAGFTLREITAGPEDFLRYRLSRGEKIFIGRK
ncbi:class I SAM-dependent methyltransferase [Sphingopyxis sp. Root154]|nr:class I SAM-dependent methyltransferase [Sphingopyxis sp. Root154]